MKLNLFFEPTYFLVNWNFIEMKDVNWAHTAIESAGVIFTFKWAT